MRKTHIGWQAMLIVLGVLGSRPLLADEEVPAPATLEELQLAIAQLVLENDVPAVGIAMVDRNGPVWIDSIGTANLEEDIDADADSMFRIGSTSKMFVSLAILKLVEEGRLSLDDRLSDLAPDVAFENLWEEKNPVRLAHLLEHTTGWDDIHLPEYAHNANPPLSLKEGLDFHPHSRVSRWVPGTRSSYCNAGPPVAAYIVERVTGQEFESYVAENFFAPLSMKKATYQMSEDVLADGVTLYANGNQPQDYWHIIVRPSGAVNASPKDMSRFLQLFVNRGVIDNERLISEASLKRMESVGTTSAAEAGQLAGYGLNNYSSTHKQWVYREHNGGVNGGLTEFAYLPEAGVGHVIMINSDDYESIMDISELVRNFETRNLTVDIVQDKLELTAEHRKIEGLYYPINARQQVSYFIDRVLGVQKLWFEDGKLLRKPLLDGKPAGYFPVSTTLYAEEDTRLIAISRVEDPLAGPVVHVDSTVLKPASVLLVYGQLGVVALWGLSMAVSLIYFLVWSVRRLRKKISPGATIRIRVWPLLATLSVLIFVAAFSAGMSDPFGTLGAPTPVSITIMLATIAFAMFAALGVYSSFKERHSAMNRANYWSSTVMSATHLVVAIYLAWFGIVGLATWA